MRYCVAVLMLLLLLAILSVMNVLAAPAPDPSGILDIGPPPRGKTTEQYLRFEIESNTNANILDTIYLYPDVRKLPSVAALKDARHARPWLAKNLRVTPDKGDRLLRFTFRAGKRNEQVTLINAFLRANLHWHDIGGETLKCHEEGLRTCEKSILDLEKRIASGLQPHMVDTYRAGINRLRYTLIPEHRAEIARLKQYAVIKWAR